MRNIVMTFVAASGLALAACAPSESQIEQSIVDGYEAEGAEDVEVSLEADDDGGYTGHVDYTDPASGQSYRHNCTVDAADGGEAAWRCQP